MNHIAKITQNLLKLEDVKELKLLKSEDGKVEIWEGNGKYVGRFSVNYNESIPLTFSEKCKKIAKAILNFLRE